MIGRFIGRLGCWWVLAGTMAAAQIAEPFAFSVQPAGPAAVTLPSAPSAVAASIQPGNQVESWWLVSPANAPFRPLEPREKLQSFVHHAYSPYTFLGALSGAAYAQALGDPYAYGGGMRGFGKRFGAGVAGTESRSFFGTFLFPTLLRQDPRYFALYKGTFKERALHALKRVVIVRDDAGHDTFNSSGLLSIAFTQSLGTAWAPEGQRTAHTTMAGMLSAVGGDATTYLLREFTPDLLRLFKRHVPERLRRMEERMPVEITGDTEKFR